jgi:hypothetical protein
MLQPEAAGRGHGRIAFENRRGRRESEAKIVISGCVFQAHRRPSLEPLAACLQSHTEGVNLTNFFKGLRQV